METRDETQPDRPPQPSDSDRPGFFGDLWRIKRFLWPFDELARLSEAENRTLLAITFMGMVPMIFLLMLFGSIRVEFVAWLTGLYFSVLWAILFYQLFPAPNIKISTSIFCFLGTGLVSISILSLALRNRWVDLPTDWVASDDLLVRARGFIIWASLPEEICKVLMLYVLSKRVEVFPPRTMVYYGMICGLGFGIYEGVEYQLHRNLQFANSQWGDYFFLNLLRFTTLPVLHAVWTGIAGFFLGFGFVHRRHLPALALAGIGIPTLLHGLFNTFNGTLTALGLAILSVLTLSLYMAKHDKLEVFLREN